MDKIVNFAQYFDLIYYTKQIVDLLVYRKLELKSKQVKRASHALINAGIEFSESFENNKKILGNEMPSKKMRNKMAGYLARYHKQKIKEAKSLEFNSEKE